MKTVRKMKDVMPVKIKVLLSSAILSIWCQDVRFDDLVTVAKILISVGTNVANCVILSVLVTSYFTDFYHTEDTETKNTLRSHSYLLLTPYKARYLV